MLEQQGMTPEEKLLRIIEAPREAAKEMKFRLKVPDLKFSLKSFQAKYADQIRKSVTLKTANSALVFFAGLVTFFLIVDFWLGLPRVAAVQRLEQAAKKMSVGDIVLNRLDPLQVYIQEVASRNVFSLPQAPPRTASESGGRTSLNSEIESFIQNLKVTGIMWSETPQAIVEDTKAGRTYLLNRGSKINDLRVKQILKDRVILSYDGQDIELR